MNRQRCLCWLWTGREESTPPGRPGANTGSAFPAPAPAPVCRVTSVPPASLSPGEKQPGLRKASWTRIGPGSVLTPTLTGCCPPAPQRPPLSREPVCRRSPHQGCREGPVKSRESKLCAQLKDSTAKISGKTKADD